eukprot:TRINITY_DN2023_c0_g1_i1.p1 TRINITY_DN2023_c0_g1~~TRINITY_DN2023_c0_g1_i1.p1  ORF type:complete len:1370 (+),score=271.57 TRINITY_DN2023_c0_g1_i1:161-4270(+)
MSSQDSDSDGDNLEEDDEEDELDEEEEEEAEDSEEEEEEFDLEAGPPMSTEQLHDLVEGELGGDEYGLDDEDDDDDEVMMALNSIREAEEQEKNAAQWRPESKESRNSRSPGSPPGSGHAMGSLSSETSTSLFGAAMAALKASRQQSDLEVVSDKVDYQARGTIQETSKPKKSIARSSQKSITEEPEASGDPRQSRVADVRRLTEKDKDAPHISERQTPQDPQDDGSACSDDVHFMSTSSESEGSSGSSEIKVSPAVRRASWVAAATSQDDATLLRVTNDDLQEASLRGDVFLVRRLIEANASVNAPMRPEESEEFMTLLHILARKPHMPNCTNIVAEMVMHKASVSARSSFGTTPLSFACHSKHVGAVETLLKSHASANPIDDYGRKAPLYAVLPPWEPELCDNSDEVLTIRIIQLLSKHGADLNDGGDVIPIVQAVQLENKKAVDALLAAGVTPYGLHDAVEKANVPIIQSLINAEANPFLKDRNQKTVMAIALSRGEEEVIDVLREFEGDLQRMKHTHLRTLEENRKEEEEEGAREREVHLDQHKESAAKARLQDNDSEDETYWNGVRERSVQIARKVGKNKIFSGVMFGCLFIALFVADVWVAGDIENADVLDAILIAILLGFTAEFIVQLIAHTRTYAWSFFFWMDLFGIISVPLDHSLVLNAIPSGVGGNTVVLRAARMAKLGARAGRFTKLVKLLRFLPGMQQTDTVGTARVLSATLNMALSTRVSSLIIVMVMMLPLFSLASYPENDFSMKMWVDRLQDTAWTDPTRVPHVLDLFKEAYEKELYFPYEFNVGYPNGSVETVHWRNKPNRIRSRMIIEDTVHGNTSAVFNFRDPLQVEACCSIGLILTIMFLMIGAALFMSNSVTAIVVIPLEQLLDHVRSVAANIFKSMAAMKQAEQDDADQDQDEDDQLDASDAFGDETQLLDKVLKKIAVLSEITVKKSPLDADTLERMGEADRSLIKRYSSMDTDGLEVSFGYEEDEVEELAQIAEVRLAEVGLAFSEFQRWSLDTIALSPQARHAICQCALIKHRGHAVHGHMESSDWLACCRSFLEAAEVGYLPNEVAPYHGWMHAADVTFTLSRVLDIAATEHYLSAVECYALLVAAVGHDIGHLGRNNIFLVETGHELAIRYNDKSPLENLHCSKLFEILSDPKANVFFELDAANSKQARQVIVEAILHTDYQFHVAMVKEFEALYQVNTELFNASEDMYLASASDFPATEVVDYFRGADVKKTLRNVFLHLSDVSNPMKEFEQSEQWASLVIEEFFCQGDKEKELGIPVGPLNNRDTLNVPMSQIGFIEFFVAPLSFVMARLVPPLDFSVHMLLDNVGIWYNKWVDESNPSGAERDQVNERINKLNIKSQQRG